MEDSARNVECGCESALTQLILVAGMVSEDSPSSTGLLKGLVMWYTKGVGSFYQCALDKWLHASNLSLQTTWIDPLHATCGLKMSRDLCKGTDLWAAHYLDGEWGFAELVG